MKRGHDPVALPESRTFKGQGGNRFKPYVSHNRNIDNSSHVSTLDRPTFFSQNMYVLDCLLDKKPSKRAWGHKGFGPEPLFNQPHLVNPPPTNYLGRNPHTLWFNSNFHWIFSLGSLGYQKHKKKKVCFATYRFFFLQVSPADFTYFQ